MKKPIMLISNDQHLDINNIGTVKRLMLNHIDKAIELGLHEVVLLGDMFDTRSSQKLDVAIAFLEILDECEDKGVKVIIIPGNHDKADYGSRCSWIDLYKNHPSVDLIRDTEVRNFSGVSATLIPFFIEQKLVDKIEEAESTDLLLSHFELNGSTVNGITAEDRPISTKMLRKWEKVFLGHYHDKHKVGKNIYHLPSLYQRGFGEDDVKGYTVVYDDLSHEHIQSDFKRFETIKVDIDTLTPQKQKELVKRKESDINLRVEISGDSEKLKALKKDKFIQAGIDVKIKHEGIFDEEQIKMPKLDQHTIQLTNAAIRDKFGDFCERDGLEKNKGLKYLEKRLI